MLACVDCGHNLWFNFNQRNPDIAYFMYSNYKGNRSSCGTTHYVRSDFLEQVVLGEIRRLVKYVKRHGDEFMRAAIGLCRQMAEQERQNMQREMKVLIARDRELDKIFSRMYEDNFCQG